MDLHVLYLCFMQEVQSKLWNDSIMARISLVTYLDIWHQQEVAWSRDVLYLYFKLFSSMLKSLMKCGIVSFFCAYNNASPVSPLAWSPQRPVQSDEPSSAPAERHHGPWPRRSLLSHCVPPPVPHDATGRAPSAGGQLRGHRADWRTSRDAVCSARSAAHSRTQPCVFEQHTGTCCFFWVHAKPATAATAHLHPTACPSGTTISTLMCFCLLLHFQKEPVLICQISRVERTSAMTKRWFIALDSD